MTRRNFLIASASGLSVTFLAGCALPVVPKRPAPNTEDALSWIRFANGRYTLVIPRVEMGQNILTALKQIACQELGVEWHQIDARLHSSESIRRVRATVGSESIKDFALPLARACATLREALAAGHTQGRLVAEDRPARELRSMSKGGRFVGAEPAIEQGLDIVLGRPLYAADIRRNAMLFGRVLRAPAAAELRSSVRSLDETAAARVAGFVALVRDPLLALMNSQGLGIVARTPGGLDRVEAALNLVWAIEGQFEQADNDQAIDIDARLKSDAGLSKRVHADTITSAAPWAINLRIDIPLAAHAPIEPRAAVAEFSATGDLQVWTGTQDVFYQRDFLSKRLGIPEQNVTVHGQRVGGGFGGKTICTVELEAAVLARASNSAVKVQWTRAQEFQFGFHRPPSSHRLRARFRDGRLDQWWHAIASSHILFTNAVLPPWLQRLTDLVGDDGVARGAQLVYRAAKKRTEYDLVRLPVFTGPWRGLGAGPNGLAIESAIDECARAAGADPVQFRLEHLALPRLARVLQSVAAAARWTTAQATTASAVKRGFGVACGVYKAMSYAAVVALVEVNTNSGAVKVLKLWCAHDCGLVINPDQVRAQCEGNLVWGLGMVLTDNLSVSASQISAKTFADSPIPRLSDVPPMEIVLVDEGEPASGAGETAIVASAAAIANAVRQATGFRATRFPLQPKDLRSAWQ